MINRQELQYAIDSIAIDILDEIVSPFCDIPKGTILADIYLTELNEFLDDTNHLEGEEKMIKNIIKRYQLVDSESYLETLPIAEIALYVLIHGKYNEDYKGISQ